MKKTYFLLILSALLAANLSAQEQAGCEDVIYMRGGSVYRGKLVEHDPGKTLVVQTWNGVTVHLQADQMKRIVQRCPDEKKARIDGKRSFEFREKGLYNATRLGTLAGQHYAGENIVGISLQHSIGWTFHRLLGVGVGAGAESYDIRGSDVATYPVFLEARGYLMPKYLTPYYVLAGGWAFPGRKQIDEWGAEYDWESGWMGKAQIGYRLGNHLTLYGGLSLQRKTRRWTEQWTGAQNTDRILNKRLELGFGILL